MAEPNRHVPGYHDPVQTFENTSYESLDINLEFDPDDPPGGENIMLDEDVTQLVHDRENIMLNEDMNQFGPGTSQAGPSGGVNDQNNEHMSGKFNPEISNFGNPIRLLQWPVPTEPYSCSCCQVLREIIHTIDGETRKFEIHGRLGEIFHGILEICRRDMTASRTECQMFDFCKETIPDVKEFLVQYCEERTEAGYTMVKDPLFAFNEALKVGSDWEFGLDADESLHGSPTHTDEDTDQPPEESDVSQPQARRNKRRSKRKNKKASKKASKKAKTKRDRAYQEQREFIKELELKDFADYFNLTLENAAEKVGICPSSLKTICKNAGFSWPHRQIKMYERKIQTRLEILESSADVQKKETAEAEIKEFEQLIASYAAPFKNK